MLKLIRNVNLYNPHSQGIRDVLFTEHRILAVAPHLPDLHPVYPLELIDGHGMRLIPGLIDCHVHLTGGGGESGPASRVPPLGLKALTTAGVTTAIGLLGTDGTTRSIADLLAATRSMNALGLSAFCYTGSYQVPPPTLMGHVRDDLVHIDSIVGIGEIALSDHRSSQPRIDEIARLAADAHVSGLMTGKAGVLHLHMGDGKRGLSMLRELLETTELPARTFHPTHCNRNRTLWAEAKELAKEYPITIDVTAFPPDDPDENVMSATESVLDWLDSGCPPEQLTISSDGGGCLPVFNPHGEVVALGVGTSHALTIALRNLLQAGLSLSEALPFFTTHVARQFRLDQKAHIAQGYDADLVLLDDDGEVHHVFAKGRWMVRAKEAIVQGVFES